MQRAPAAHSSKPGLARVHDLLTQAGIPLELKVAQICQRLTAQWRPLNSGFPSTSRVVYGPRDDDKPLREIDQLVQMYHEIRIGEPAYGLAPMLEIPIECKNRVRTAYYALRGPETATPRPRFPVLSDLAGSALIRDVFGREGAAFDGRPFMPIAAIEFKEDGSPQRVSEEQLVYKAGAAIHDYILYNHRGAAAEPKEAEPNFWVDSIKESKVGEMLEIDAESHYYVYWRDWLENVPGEAYDKFNSFLFGGPGVWHHSVQVYIPIICVDSPLFEVGLRANGKLGKPKRTKWALTSSRLPGWPGAIREEMSGSTAEAALVLCNVNHLEELLRALHAWFENCCAGVLKTSPDVIRRAPLEAAIRKLVRSSTHYKERSGYRSDYDHEDDRDPPSHGHSKFKMTKETKGATESPQSE